MLLTPYRPALKQSLAMPDTLPEEVERAGGAAAAMVDDGAGDAAAVGRATAADGDGVRRALHMGQNSASGVIVWPQ